MHHKARGGVAKAEGKKMVIKMYSANCVHKATTLDTQMKM